MAGMARSHHPTCYAAWTTAWGPMGAVADGAGLTRVVLPHYRMDDLAALLAWEHPGASPDEEPFAAFMELSRAYFNAKPVGFPAIPCQLPPERSFSGQVLRACRAIPHGQSVSYGELARRIGQEEAARAVATALSRNPTPLVIPCHRVTYSNGQPGGFSAEGGPALKQRLLALEKGGA